MLDDKSPIYAASCRVAEVERRIAIVTRRIGAAVTRAIEAAWRIGPRSASQLPFDAGGGRTGVMGEAGTRLPTLCWATAMAAPAPSALTTLDRRGVSREGLSVAINDPQGRGTGQAFRTPAGRPAQHPDRNQPQALHERRATRERTGDYPALKALLTRVTARIVAFAGCAGCGLKQAQFWR